MGLSISNKSENTNQIGLSYSEGQVIRVDNWLVVLMEAHLLILDHQGSKEYYGETIGIKSRNKDDQCDRKSHFTSTSFASIYSSG